MLIKDRPEYASKPKPLTCSADRSMKDAIAEMSARNFGSIVVVDNDQRVVGMVTERDVMKRLVNEGLDPAETTVSQIMTPNPRVAREEDEMIQWLRIMSNERFRRLPIVDADGRLVSIMTQGDFVSYTWPDLIQRATTLTRSTLSGNWHIVILAVGLLVYTLVLLSFFTSPIT